MKDRKRSPEPEAMMGPRSFKRPRLSTPEGEKAHSGCQDFHSASPGSSSTIDSAYGRDAAGPSSQQSRQALAAKAAEARAATAPPPIRKARLMTLSEMSFRTVLTHLSCADEETLAEVASYAPSLNPRHSAPLLQACKEKQDRLKRIERAKLVASKAREEEKLSRPTAIAISDVSVISRMSRPVKRVEKTPGGRRIWAAATAAAAAAGRRR